RPVQGPASACSPRARRRSRTSARHLLFPGVLGLREGLNVPVKLPSVPSSASVLSPRLRRRPPPAAVFVGETLAQIAPATSSSSSRPVTRSPFAPSLVIQVAAAVRQSPLLALAAEDAEPSQRRPPRNTARVGQSATGRGRSRLTPQSPRRPARPRTGRQRSGPSAAGVRLRPAGPAGSPGARALLCRRVQPMRIDATAPPG